MIYALNVIYFNYTSIMYKSIKISNHINIYQDIIITLAIINSTFINNQHIPKSSSLIIPN
jgi:hypothetical protein